MIRMLTAIAVTVTIAAASPALASACNDEIVVPIKLSETNHYSWSHKGLGDHFFGQFQKGQKISIGAAGGTNYNTRGDLSWVDRDPWTIHIEGPGGFHDYSDGALYATLPATGKYVISMGPCAIWGKPGTVVVSATDPRLTIQ